MLEMLSEKISLLNETMLECLREDDEQKIVQAFTEVGIKITGADFGFVWLKASDETDFKLIYKSEGLPYEPLPPRHHGKNYNAFKNGEPYFESEIEKISDEYDVSPYMKSFVIIPISYRGTVYGNIVLCFKNQQTFPERSLYGFLGNGAAQAITINRLIKSEHHARVAAEKQGARFQALIENSFDAIVLIDQGGLIVDASPSVSRMTGYLAGNLLGRNIGEFIHVEDTPIVSGHMKRTLQNPGTRYTIEFRYLHEDGSWRWMESTGVNMLSNPNVGSIVANIRDITDRKTSEATIRHQAFHDPLTDLPNREEMRAKLDQALETAKRKQHMLAVMFVDMDRFKKINDNLGHATGDMLLKIIASRFLAVLRAEDVVSRFGGDEFIILLSEIHSSKDAVQVADKILKAISLPVQIGEHKLHPTVSMGIAVYPHDGDDGDTLKKHADIALYKAKQRGRNRFELYEHSLEVYASEKFKMESELHLALSRNEITLYYQPIVNLKNGSVVSVEALARWQHPERGLLLPGEFIPLAEESGLIVQLDECVMQMACQQLKVWQTAGLPHFRMAVNLSAQQFAQPDFISKLQTCLKKSGLDGEQLEMEITESLAMTDLEMALVSLKTLKKMGIYITIDDFGTGYSSLNYLKHFPIHSLKIDRSFVRQCITSSQDASIVRTIVAMAHNLNLKVIAEGVETDQQLGFLKSVGCNAAQGFCIARPMPAEQIPVWLVGKKSLEETASRISPFKNLGKKIFVRKQS